MQDVDYRIIYRTRDAIGNYLGLGVRSLAVRGSMPLKPQGTSDFWCKASRSRSALSQDLAEIHGNSVVCPTIVPLSAFA